MGEAESVGVAGERGGEGEEDCGGLLSVVEMEGEVELEWSAGFGATVAVVWAAEEDVELLDAGAVDAGWVLLAAVARVWGALLGGESFLSFVPLPNFLVSFLNITHTQSSTQEAAMKCNR